MIIKPAPVSTFALTHSITQAEWEALRVAAERIERTVGRRMDDTYLANAPATVMPKIIAHYAHQEIRSILGDSGLDPEDWFIHLAPVLPPGPLPPRIEEWVLHLRLHKEVSKAKAAAIEANRPTGYLLVPFKDEE